MTCNTPSPCRIRFAYVRDVRNGRSVNVRKSGTTRGPIGARFKAPSSSSVVTSPSRIKARSLATAAFAFVVAFLGLGEESPVEAFVLPIRFV